MSVPLLVFGIIFSVLGISSIIGSILVSRFSWDSCKIVKFDNIDEKFKRNHTLEGFISVYSWTSGFTLAFIGFLLIADCFMPTKSYTPTAIDVYRGRTELEIHSINNIPQDTIVVWKGGMEK